jgi:hypothetical protein
MSDKVKNNKEIVLALIKINWFVLQYANEELKNDKEVVMEAVKQNGWALQFASNELRSDKEVVMEAIKQNKKILEHASKLIPKWFKEESKNMYFMDNKNEELSKLLNFEDWISLNKDDLLLNYENKITKKVMDKEKIILIDKDSKKEEVQAIIKRFKEFQKELYNKYVEEFNSIKNENKENNSESKQEIINNDDNNIKKKAKLTNI